MCAPVCPAYANRPQENNSPRARNQAIRLIWEGQLKPKALHHELKNLITSCTLCGRCTQQCPGQIPTAQHILELRRRLCLPLLPQTLFTLLRLRETFPHLFKTGVRAGLYLRHTGLLHLLACADDFSWLKHALAILPAAIPAPFTAENKTRPTLIYLPSLEAEFFQPALAQQVYQTASKKHRVCVWQNTACGLFEYVYGDLPRARQLVKNLITRHARTANATLPLLTDSIDVYNFLRQSPQLFDGFTRWQAKAVRFAQCVRFVTDLLPKNSRRMCTPPVLLMSTALFTQDSPAQQAAREILHSLFKKNFVQCEYKDACTAPAGYGFVSGPRATQYNVQAVRTVAKHQAQSVVVLSGLAELELNFYLRRFYPSARAHHLARLNG